MFRIMLLICLLLGEINVFAAEPAYRLNAGDAVLVSVWREDALQREVRVLPDGSITFPLAGRIEVGGLETTEVAKRIAAKLKEYISDPNVTVVITSIEGNRVFVLGKVVRPGPFVMNGPVTILQALSMAGGLDRFADESSIKVVRHKGEGQEVLAVSYKELISGRNMATNIQLKAGDTVLVP